MSRAPLTLVFLAGSLACAGCATGTAHTGTAPAGMTEATRGPGTVRTAANMAPSSTEIGAKAAELRAQLDQLKEKVRSDRAALDEVRARAQADEAAYQGVVAGITARLQIGTTKGNPRLVAQWAEAGAKLDVVEQGAAQMRALAESIGQSGDRAASIAGATRATLGLSGAVEEDHVVLNEVQDETGALLNQLSRLSREIDAGMARQAQAQAAERKRLAALQTAIGRGELSGTIGLETGPVAKSRDRDATVSKPASERALVVIRFEQTTVAYEAPVTQAAKAALARLPNAKFEVAAIVPAGRGPAETAQARAIVDRNIEGVVRTMVEAGIAKDKIRTTQKLSAQVGGPEIHIFVR